MMTVLSIVNAVLFDGESSEPFESSLHIEGGRIVGVGGPAPGGAEVIDASGRLVSPGLIDAHFHANGIGLDLMELEATPLSYVTAKAARRLEATLRRGFTTVRDPAGGDLGLQRALEEGVIKGPRYFFAGRTLTQTGGHGDGRPAHLELEYCRGHIGEVVDGVDNLRLAVRERFRTGSHCIKIMTSGGVVSPTDPLRIPQYSPDEVRAVCEEATRRESYVAAHAYSPEAIVHSITNGVRTIEHGNLIDQAAAELMAESDAFLVPTLVAYDAMRRRGAGLGLPPIGQEKNREVLEAGEGSIQIARSAGVRIGLGTDLMGDLENDQLVEFQIRNGVESVADTLRSATSVNADIIGRPDLGRISEGAPADLVIFAGNAFEDPSVLWDDNRQVIQTGAVVT